MQLDLETLISSAEGSPASPGPLPGSAEARKMTVTSGQKCAELLPLLGLLTSTWGSGVCFLTWKLTDTKFGPSIFQLAPSMPRIDVRGSGWWATPNANEDRAECYALETTYRHAQEGRQIHLAQEMRDPRLWRTPLGTDGEKSGHGNLPHQVRKMIPTPTASDHIERRSTSSEKLNPMTGKSVSLDRFVKFWPDEETQKSGKPEMWPTPGAWDDRGPNPKIHEAIARHLKKGVNKQVGLRDAVMWPTPAERDYRHPNKKPYAERGGGKKGEQLPNAVGGSLNPTWVEWLMGFPVGWTDLEPSETPSSPRSSSGSAKPSSKRKGNPESMTHLLT
jgi:hypothetical protein